MHWKTYFFLNCILLAAVLLTVLTIETTWVEKLSVVAGLISIAGLYSYIYKDLELPRIFWMFGLMYLLVIGFAANIYSLIPEYQEMASWEPFLYFALILFHFPTYYIFFKKIKD